MCGMKLDLCDDCGERLAVVLIGMSLQLERVVPWSLSEPSFEFSSPS